MKTYKVTGRDGAIKWGIDYVVGVKRVRRIVADTKKQAAEIGAQVQVELREGKYFDRKTSGKTTLGELIELYKVHFKGKDSYKTEMGHLGAIQSFWKDDTLISAIDIGAVEDFKRARLDAPNRRGGKKDPSKKRSPSTINRELECLRRVLYFAMKRKLLRGENPVQGEMLSDEPKGKISYLTEEEAESLIAAARKVAQSRGAHKKNYHLPAIIITALYTGMRLSNVLNLRWTDIDFRKRNLHLPDTKPGDSLNVPMAKLLMEELDRVTRRLGSGYVFAKEDGEAYKRIDRSFKRARDLAGIPRTFTFHGLRHTFVTWALAGGWPIHVVARIVGHSTTRMTEVYAHLLPDAGHDVVDSLPDLSGRGVSGVARGASK